VWPASHITLAGQPCVGAFPETIFSTCPEEAVFKLSNVQRRCKEETWPPDQVAWLAGLTSGSHMATHCLNPPINTPMLPLGRKCEESEV
jgi:hypothetical protein